MIFKAQPKPRDSGLPHDSADKVIIAGFKSQVFWGVLNYPYFEPQFTIVDQL